MENGGNVSDGPGPVAEGQGGAKVDEDPGVKPGAGVKQPVLRVPFVPGSCIRKLKVSSWGPPYQMWASPHFSMQNLGTFVKHIRR